MVSEQPWDSVVIDLSELEKSGWKEAVESNLARLEGTTIRTERVRILRETATIFENELSHGGGGVSRW